MRLNAYLARAGVASRRRADDLIREGRVRVNGEVGQLNTVVGRRDVVDVDGERVDRQPLTYVLLHKPAGVVTTARDPQGRRTVVDLVPTTPRVVPVGRLDADTTGALLLTNDGDLAHRLAHPRYGVPKVYDAYVVGRPTEAELWPGSATVSSSMTASRHPRACASSRRAPQSSCLEVTLHEGRKHQIKRMCEAVGHPVRGLHRRGYAGLDLAGLEPGQWRELTPAEVAALKAAVGL